MKNILRILILFLFVTNISFGLDLVRGGNIVHDDSTKLQWEDSDSVRVVRKSWDYGVNYCRSLILDGRSDWRLPRKNELLTLVDYSKSNPAIKENAFKNITANYYWSSTPNAALTNYAWHISFDTGLIGYSPKKNMEYVRCVRSTE